MSRVAGTIPQRITFSFCAATLSGLNCGPITPYPGFGNPRLEAGILSGFGTYPGAGGGSKAPLNTYFHCVGGAWFRNASSPAKTMHLSGRDAGQIRHLPVNRSGSRSNGSTESCSSENITGYDEARCHDGPWRSADPQLAHDAEQHVGFFATQPGVLGHEVDRGL